MSGPDYTSLVPHYTFAETLAEQEAQLAENPLLQRMIASRKAKERRSAPAGVPLRQPGKHAERPQRPLFLAGIAGTSSTRAIRRTTPGSTGDTPSARTSSTGATFPTPSTPTRKSAASRARALVEDDQGHSDLPRDAGRQYGCRLQRPSAAQLGEGNGSSRLFRLRPWIGPGRSRTGCSIPASGRRTASTILSPAGTVTEGPRPGRGLRPISSSARRTWRPGSTCILSPRTTGSRLVGDDGACPYFWPIADRHMLLFFSHTSGGQYLLGDYDHGARQAGRHVPRSLQLRAVHTVGGPCSLRDTRRSGWDHRDLQHEPGAARQRAGTRS